ncbi:hypothetical protein ABW21_db0209049 [Orbilia brochopaga]|nr:hypothetical protein ABW21_db0209049 [Drechslerella brochopaga]
MNWEETAPEHDSGQGGIWLASLSASTGIDPSFEPKETNMDDEHQNWRSKWGDDVANGLKRSVELAQEDYIYLRKNSILVPEH